MKFRVKLNRIQVITIVVSLAVITTVVTLIIYYGVQNNNAELTPTTTDGNPIIPPGPDTPETVVLEIGQGRLEGQNRQTAKLEPYTSFENIPFAEPPVGSLAFKDPIQATGWDDVRDATVRGPLCLQANVFNTQELEIIGDADCLQLNVYTPDTSPDELLPVMVYIHGGGFDMSTDQFFNNVEMFMGEGVILVKVNYRLGVIGFLSLGTEDVPGNAGLKDQVLALKWVRDNIESFGGNKDSVTIFGESAGGASVTFLQVSQMADGLFHQVIAMSGTNLNVWTIQDNPTSKAEQLVNLLGLTDISEEDLLGQLQDTPVSTLLSASLNIGTENIIEIHFGPVLEQIFVGKEAFLTETPLWHYESGQFSDVPTMIGYANYEYAAFYNDDFFLEIINNPTYYFPASWNLTSNDTLFDEAVSRVREFYFGGQDFNPEDQEQKIRGIDLIGDITFFLGIDDTARALAKYSSNSTDTTYYYRFSYSGSLGNPIVQTLGLQGATHADELFYIFPFDPIAEDTSDDRVSKRLLKLYTNFARYGNPTPEPETTLLPATWLPVTEDVVNYLEINAELTPSTEPDGDRSRFWRELKAYVDAELSTPEPDDATPSTTESEDATPSTTESEDATPTTTESEDTTPTTTESEDATPTTPESEDATPTTPEQEAIVLEIGQTQQNTEGDNRLTVESVPYENIKRWLRIGNIS